MNRFPNCLLKSSSEIIIMFNKGVQKRNVFLLRYYKQFFLTFHSLFINSADGVEAEPRCVNSIDFMQKECTVVWLCFTCEWDETRATTILKTRDRLQRDILPSLYILWPYLIYHHHRWRQGLKHNVIFHPSFTSQSYYKKYNWWSTHSGRSLCRGKMEGIQV